MIRIVAKKTLELGTHPTQCELLVVPCHGIQTLKPPQSLLQLPGYAPEEHPPSLVGYLECPLGEQLGLALE